MLNTLIDRKDRNIARTTEASVVEYCLQASHHLWRAIGRSNHPIYKIGAWKMKHTFIDARTLVFKERLTAFAHQIGDALEIHWNISV